MAAHRAGNLAAAELCYRQMLQLNPQQPDAWHLLGTLALQRGQYEPAREQIARAIAIEPRAARITATWAPSTTRWADSTRLNKATAARSSLAPTFGDAQYNLGRVLVRRKAYSEAIVHLETALRFTPNSAGAQQPGCGPARDGPARRSRRSTARAVQLDPTLAESHNNLGIVYRLQRRWPEALACHQQALRIRPQFVDAHFSLANTLRQMRSWDEAAASYREVLRLRPDDADAYLALGQTYKEQVRLEDAIDCFQRAARIRPDDPAAYQSLGFALVRLRRPEEAEVALRRRLN